MVPFPNPTNNNSKDEEKFMGTFSEFLYFLKKIFLPQGYKSAKEDSILHIKNKSSFFDIPVIEAITTSRWTRTRRYWMIPLILYIIFLVLFSFLSQLLLSDSDNENKHDAKFMTMVGIFYYVGIYLLIIELMPVWPVWNYMFSSDFSLFNIFDLFSTILGVVVFTFIFVKSYNDAAVGINNEDIVILLTVTTLILWIEMVCIINIICQLKKYLY
jgi:hypothetical protein